MTSLLAQIVGHSFLRQALLACLFGVMPLAYVVLTCFCTLMISWVLLQDVTGTDLLKPVSEDVNELLTSDGAEVCINSAHFQAYLKDTVPQLSICCRQYQKHTAKGHQGRAMIASFSCYIQTQKARQQLTSFKLQPRCVCNLQMWQVRP